MRKITIILADDHGVVREALKALLAAEPEFEIVGEAVDGKDALELARSLRPDIAIMDIAMPRMNGLHATRRITREIPDTKVVILSCYGDEEYVEESTQAGARAFLVKQTASNDLFTAIREVVRNKSYFSPSIQSRIQNRTQEQFLNGAPRNGKRLSLTARELEVLQLIAAGNANKQIASTLLISIKTVEKHRQQVMNKLNIHDVAGLTRYAIARELV